MGLSINRQDSCETLTPSFCVAFGVTDKTCSLLDKWVWAPAASILVVDPNGKI